MASSSIDTLNVIYRSHTLILLVSLLQIYVHLSTYTSLITRNALKNNNGCNFLQKSSAETKIAAIFYVNVIQIWKTQFHWSSRMEWPGINQSALTTYQPHETLYFLFHRFEALLITSPPPSWKKKNPRIWTDHKSHLLNFKSAKNCRSVYKFCARWWSTRAIQSYQSRGFI